MSSRIRDQPFGIQWRKALVSLPRLVPSHALKYTCPEGPHPVEIKIPGRTHGRSIPVSIFLPPASSVEDGATQLPTVIDHHGGSMVLGTTMEQVPFCAKLARELGCIVVSVDYALGPADQFPMANYDCEDVVYACLNPAKPGYQEFRQGIAQHLQKEGREPFGIDSHHLALSGFSSGGNLALELVLDLKPPVVEDHWPSPFPPDYPNNIPVLLYYPSLDARLLPDERPLPEGMPEPTKKSWLKALALERNLMPTYLPRDKAAHPRASPGLAPISSLHPKADILLYLCEYDTLSAQSLEWIKAVKDGARDSTMRVVTAKGVPHGFNVFPDVALSEEQKQLKRESYDLATNFLWEKWGVPSKLYPPEAAAASNAKETDAATRQEKKHHHYGRHHHAEKQNQASK